MTKFRKAVHCNSVKIILSPPNPHMHIFIMSTKIYKASKISIENCRRRWLHKPYTIKRDEQTDWQMVRQGQILMPPDYRHWGIKKSETMGAF